MSNNHVQKQLDFIVEQQAQFVLNQEKADERLTRLENIVANAHVDMRNRYNALVDAQLKTEEKIGGLAETIGGLAERIGGLAEAQKRTEDRLNIFIDVVERHITSHNGDPR